MTISKQSSSYPMTSKSPRFISGLSTLSDMTTQIRSIADVFHEQRLTIEQMSQRIQMLEHCMKSLELPDSTETTVENPSLASQFSSQRNTDYPRRRKMPFFPKLVSRLTKIYFVALFVFALLLAASIILSIGIDIGLLNTIWDVFYRAGALLLLSFGCVAVQQSVR